MTVDVDALRLVADTIAAAGNTADAELVRAAADRLAQPQFPGYPVDIPNRILWNVRGGDIDEIVISNCTVHVEQMDSNCWWIGITRADGGYWAGNFHTRRSRMTFTEQEREGFEWDHEGAHRERT